METLFWINIGIVVAMGIVGARYFYCLRCECCDHSDDF